MEQFISKTGGKLAPSNFFGSRENNSNARATSSGHHRSQQNLPPPQVARKPPQKAAKFKELPVGSVWKSKWKVVSRIGGGAFGDVYLCSHINDGTECALKVEPGNAKNQLLRMEVAVLKALQKGPHVCRYIGSGRTAEYNYLIMELVGRSIAELRKAQPHQRFSLPTTLQLGMEMLACLKAIHQAGYLHRDVKPSNFAIGRTPETRRSVYMLDFGLARRFLQPNGQPRQPRHQAGFRGTSRYASLNAHNLREMGRHDDLWSLFYVLVELALGKLPWRRLSDKDEIARMKMRYTNANLVKGLPKGFQTFILHLESLDYYREPRYDYLHQILLDMLHEVGGDTDTPYDWEVDQTASSLSESASMPDNLDAEPIDETKEGQKEERTMLPEVINGDDENNSRNDMNVDNVSDEDKNKNQNQGTPSPGGDGYANRGGGVRNVTYDPVAAAQMRAHQGAMAQNWPANTGTPAGPDGAGPNDAGTNPKLASGGNAHHMLDVSGDAARKLDGGNAGGGSNQMDITGASDDDLRRASRKARKNKHGRKSGVAEAGSMDGMDPGRPSSNSRRRSGNGL